MPRTARICFPGALYHIIQKGNEGRDIFNDDADKWHLLKLFLQSKKTFEYLLHCYVLMKNHFHVTIETTNAVPVSKIMQFVSGSYATYFNQKYERKGHLFQGRFKSILVDKDDYMLELSRYIHLNPVKAAIVTTPEQHRWSSYDIYIGLRKDMLVDTETIYSYFDSMDIKIAQAKYKDFVEYGMAELEEKEDWLERKLIRRRFLGSSDFVKKCVRKNP